MEFGINHLTSVIFGEGVSAKTGENLKGNGVGKVLCVYDKGIKSTGIADKIISNIKAQNIGVVEYDAVKPDPPVETVDEAAELGRRENVDAVLGIGGGSSMDTAKAVNVLLGNPGSIRTYLDPAAVQKPGKMVFAIPTSAGTGSEVTGIAVVSNREAGLKQGLKGPNTTAKLAIVDPELTLGLPPDLTAAGGMDSFSHAAEAYTSFLSNPMTDLLALEAIRLIAKYLPVAVKNGSDIGARSKLSFACIIAGMAFNEAMVHLGHAVAHSMGAVHHIPHGLGCGLAVPMALEYLYDTYPDKLRSIGKAMGVKLNNKMTNKQAGKAVADAIRKMNKKSGLPALDTLGFGKDALSNIIHEATRDICWNFLPKKLDENEALKLLQKEYSQK